MVTVQAGLFLLNETVSHKYLVRLPEAVAGALQTESYGMFTLIVEGELK